MISDDLAPVSVTVLAANWNRFNFSWVTSRSKRPKNTWVQAKAS
jgi:hypothetical protein